jgi:tetratricopeptide (TPR) repeat protein
MRLATVKLRRAMATSRCTRVQTCLRCWVGSPGRCGVPTRTCNIDMRPYNIADPQQNRVEARAAIATSSVAPQSDGEGLARTGAQDEDLRTQPRAADARQMFVPSALQPGGRGQPQTVLEESVSEPANVGRVHFDRAKFCAAQGDVSGAILAYEAAVKVAPDFAQAYSNLGNLYLQSGRRDDALHAYTTAVRANPDLAPVYCNLANVLIELERCDEAIAASATALRLAPDLYEAHANLCRAYRRSGRDREALAPALRATELRPDRDAFVNLGATAFQLDVLGIALDANRRALELDAMCAAAHTNLGWIYHVTGRHTEAIAAGEAAIAAQPDFALAHVNLALSLLICGDFARGWDEYVWIWHDPARPAQYQYLDRVTLWNGESFAGRQLLITFDQGFGDAIQMVRYLPAVKARGGHVILEVKPALISLFAGLPGVDELHVRSDVAILADDVDLQIPLLGLPRALATELNSIPAPIPYLRAQQERVDFWRPRLESPARLRVGIVWAGSPDRDSDRHRSVRLEDFAALGAIDGIAWFGLQKGRDEERRSCGSFTLDPLGAEIGDFADTAAILTQLDLVIAVDTAIVHLAGALGTPVWTLLQFAPDWRWLLARLDSPWYPTMRLFRQPTRGDWASVFAEVTRGLRAFKPN